MPRKFKGPLNTPIEPRIRNNHLLPPDHVDGLTKKWIREDWEKLTLLCHEYRISTDEQMFMNLSLALARDFVPGFKERMKRGKKTKWTTIRKGFLVVELEREKERHKCSATKAAQLLANSEPWISFMESRDKIAPSPNPGESLRRLYGAVYRTGLASVYRKYFESLMDTNDLPAWQSELNEVFGRE